MVSVQSVYETVKNLANKDQKGFVTPEIFNSFAKAAQLKIFHEIFQETIEGKKLRRSQVDAGRSLSLVDRNKSDLSVFSTKVGLTKNFATSAFERPDDLHSVIGVKTSGATKKPAHLVFDEDKIEHILSSSLSAPSLDFPVALISDDIEMFPTNVSKITLSYYRTPLTPMYQITTAILNGTSIELFNPQTSTDFELPSKYEPELIDEIAHMIGVNMKEQIVLSYGSSEDNEA